MEIRYIDYRLPDIFKRIKTPYIRSRQVQFSKTGRHICYIYMITARKKKDSMWGILILADLSREED